MSSVVTECHYIMICNTYNNNDFLSPNYIDLFNFIKLLLKFGKITSKLEELKLLIKENIIKNMSEKNNLLLKKILNDFIIIRELNNTSSKNELDNKYFSIYFNLSESNLITRLEAKCKALIKCTEIKNIIFIISSHGFENKIYTYNKDNNSKIFGGFYSNDDVQINISKLINIFNTFNQYFFIDACRSLVKEISKEEALKNYSYNIKSDKKIVIVYPSSKYNTTIGENSTGGILVSKLIEYMNLITYENLFSNCGSVTIFKMIEYIIKNWNYLKYNLYIPHIYANSEIRKNYNKKINELIEFTNQSRESVIATKRNPNLDNKLTDSDLKIFNIIYNKLIKYVELKNDMNTTYKKNLLFILKDEKDEKLNKILNESLIIIKDNIKKIDAKLLEYKNILIKFINNNKTKFFYKYFNSDFNYDDYNEIIYTISVLLA